MVAKKENNKEPKEGVKYEVSCQYGDGVSFDTLAGLGYDPQTLDCDSFSKIVGEKVKTIRIDNSMKIVFNVRGK